MRQLPTFNAEVTNWKQIWETNYLFNQKRNINKIWLKWGTFCYPECLFLQLYFDRHTWVFGRSPNSVITQNIARDPHLEVGLFGIYNRSDIKSCSFTLTKAMLDQHSVTRIILSIYLLWNVSTQIDQSYISQSIQYLANLSIKCALH